MRYYAVFLALLLFIMPAAATTAFGVPESFLVEDVTSYGSSAGSDSIYTEVSITADCGLSTSYALESNTYTINTQITKLNWYSSTVAVNYHSKVTGNSTTYSETWYHMGMVDLTVLAGSPGADEDGSLRGKTLGLGKTLSDEIVYAPTEIYLSSTAPVSVLVTPRTQEEIDASAPGFILDIIDKVPYVGPYISDALAMAGAILKAFFYYSWLFINNIVLFIVVFEIAVFLHGIVILQGKGSHQKRVTNSIRAIVGDNKIALELVFGLLMKGLELVYRVIQSIGNWIPFT